MLVFLSPYLKLRLGIQLQKKLEKANSPEAGIEMAQAAGFVITAEGIQSMDTQPVSDEELEHGLGGCNRYVPTTRPIRIFSMLKLVSLSIDSSCANTSNQSDH